MKHLTLSILLFSAIWANAQEKIGTYTPVLTGQAYDVTATAKGDIYLFTHTFDHLNKQCGVLIKAKNLHDFRVALSSARDVFMDWSSKAKVNNVEDATKAVTVDLPRIDAFFYYGSSPHMSYGHPPEFTFYVNNGVTSMVFGTGELTASDNQFMKHEGPAIILSTKEDFDTLIAALDPDKVSNHFATKAATDSLFK